MGIYNADIYIIPEEVLTATGRSVASTDIEQAKAVIESITGVFMNQNEREVPLSNSDAAWIKRAVLFQTAWATENVDSLARTGASSLSQDGVSVSAPDSLTFVLAPLAKRALANCSWAKSGTIKVAPADEVVETSFLTSDDHAWAPLGSI